MKIVGYLRTSLIEWPGKISSVVFVPGCNFRCPFCYNRDLVLHPEKLAPIPEKEIFKDLKKRKKWIDGVVVTGGEPLLSPDLPEFLKKVKDLGFLTKIYTNGSKPAVLRGLLTKKLLDAVTMDIKGPLDRRYSKAAGVSVNLAEIRKSIRLILDSGIEFLFATTIVPGLHKKEDLVNLARDLAKRKPSWILQQFWPRETCLDSKFKKIKPYSKMEMKKFLKAVKAIFPGVKSTEI